MSTCIAGYVDDLLFYFYDPYSNVKFSLHLLIFTETVGITKHICLPHKVQFTAFVVISHEDSWIQ